jgi:putative flippase GtrA
MKFFDASMPRFVAAGTANTIAIYVVYAALLQVLRYRLAYTLAFIAGILLSYALNARFVFRRRVAWRTAWQFPLIYVLQFVLGLALVSLCVEWLHVPQRLALLMTLVVTIPLSYFAIRNLFRVGAQE